VEGPKKIQDVHREARMEAVMTADRNRDGPRGGRGGGGGRGDRRGAPDGGYGPRGGGGGGGYGQPPPQRPPPPVRLDDRLDNPIRPMRSSMAQDVLGPDGGLRPGGGGGGSGPPSRGMPDPPSPSGVSLRPQAGPGRGLSMGMRSDPGRGGGMPSGPRGGPPGMMGAGGGPYRSREPSPAGSGSGRSPDSGSEGASRKGTAAETGADRAAEREEGEVMDEDTVAAKAKLLADEFYRNKDMKEALLCMSELHESRVDMAMVLEKLLLDGMESKGRDWQKVIQLVVDLSAEEKAHLGRDAIDAGVRKILDQLADLSMDVPKAPEQLGQLAGRLSLADLIPLKALVEHLLKAGDGEEEEGEDPSLMAASLCLPIAAAALSTIKEAKGSGEAASQWSSVGVDLKALLPSFDRDDPAVLANEVQRLGLAFLQPLEPAKAKLEEIVAAGKGSQELIAFVEDSVDKEVAQLPEFALMATGVVLRMVLPDAKSLPPLDGDGDGGPLLEQLKPYLPFLKRFNSKALQLACIHAVQEIFHDYGHPKGLMRRLLNDLYYGDVLEEPAIMMWRDEREDSPAKQRAIIDASAWLNWLEQQEETDN